MLRYARCSRIKWTNLKYKCRISKRKPQIEEISISKIMNMLNIFIRIKISCIWGALKPKVYKVSVYDHQIL